MKFSGKQHIKDLTKHYGIIHRYIPEDESPHAELHPIGAKSVIYTPPICDARSYTAALHEIGHIARRAVDLKCYLTNMVSIHTLNVEVAAWQYAMQQAKEPLDTKYISKCLTSYLLHCTPQPPRAHIIWSLILKPLEDNGWSF